MTEPKHIPGPWQYQDADGCFDVVASDGRWVAYVAGTPSAENRPTAVTREMRQATGHLISAAPDLLAFVTAIAKRDPVFAKGHEKQVIAAARALVAKAEGSAQ
jgi:hypothetical protein